AEVADVLRRLEACRGWRVQTSATAGRDLFHRGVVTWNPDLRSELEPACDGDPAPPLRRDPPPSLLHELVPALPAREGRAADEFEAVRIENIYRRGAHLCQRTRYGDALLPTTMRNACGRSAPNTQTASSAPSS